VLFAVQRRRLSRLLSRAIAGLDEEPANRAVSPGDAERFLNRVRKFDSCRGHSSDSIAVAD
jgi:hypothetical protein